MWHKIVHFLFKWRTPSKRIIQVNDFVIWEVNQMRVWDTSKRVVYIDSFENRQFVWVDGSMTGIPIDQLTVDPSTMRG